MMRRLLGWLLIALTFGFLTFTIAGQWQEVSALDWRLDPLRLALSLALLVLTLGWGVWIWKRVLGTMGVHLRLRAMLKIWFLASLARYVPGKVWQFVGAAHLGRAFGVPAVPLVTSMVLNMGFTMAAAVVLGVPLLAGTLLTSDGLIALITGLTIAAALVLVHPAALNRALRLVPKALHKEVLLWRGGWGDGLLLLAFALLSWTLYGVAFALFTSAVFPVPMSAMPGLIGANAVAVLAGILSVVTPAGLGVREFTLTALLQPYLPAAGAAAVLAVLSRLWIVAGELLGAALSVFLARRAVVARRAGPTAGQ